MKGETFTKFAWICPGEHFGDDSFFYSRNGGFAYLLEEGHGGGGERSAIYFPVVHAQVGNRHFPRGGGWNRHY